MIILGSDRVVTQDYVAHKTAEDYSGVHKGIVKFNGSGRVIRVVNKYVSHEDSINYYDFTTNQYRYKDGDYYNCVSITGKTTRFKNDELGGNCVVIEGYIGNDKYTIGIYHMDQVLVNVGDVVNSDTIVGYQGNTGLVASSKARTDPTYGTHLHVEVKKGSSFVNPRDFAIGNKVLVYQEQTNKRDTSVNQLSILVDSIRIRSDANVSSLILGNVYMNEIYTIIDMLEDASYTWYKIMTSTNISGFIAASKTDKWIEIYNASIIPEPEPVPTPTPVDPTATLEKVFVCEKEDTYYIKLYKGEELYLKK